MTQVRIPPPCWTLFDAEFVTLEERRAVIRFHTSEQHTNPYGSIQGGLLAAMIDNCIGPAVYLVAPDRRFSTIELKINYLGSVRPGDVLLGEAEVIHQGRTTAYVEASLRLEDGSLVARASATNVFLEQVAIPEAASLPEGLAALHKT